MKYQKDKFNLCHVPVTSDKTQKLPYAHYTDNRFKTAQLVFSDGNKPQDGAYSDRLQQWDYKAYEKGRDEANKSGFSPRTAGWFEVLLSVYFAKKTVINQILTGYNLSSGYDYYYFAWSFESESVSVDQ